MNRSFTILNLIFILLSVFNATSAVPVPRQHILMDKNWKFIQSDVEGAEKLSFDDSKWRTLHLPHDWSIEVSSCSASIYY